MSDAGDDYGKKMSLALAAVQRMHADVSKLLVEAAHAAAHTKHTYLSAQYHRLAARRGKKKAMIAVGHSILVIIYQLLDQQVSYEELGGNFFDERDRKATEKRLVKRLEQLGYHVELQEVPQVA